MSVEVAPSPKLHRRVVIVPVDVSVNDTLSGAVPLFGADVKFATGPTEVARIRPGFVNVFEPPGPVTVRLTENVPAA